MTVSGVLRPRRGDIQFDGRRIEAHKPAEIVGLGLGHVPEGRQLFPTMTVGREPAHGACARAGKERRTETMPACSSWFPRLRERRRQVAGTLSAGSSRWSR